MSNKSCIECIRGISCHMMRTLINSLGILRGCEPFYEDDKISEMTEWVNGLAAFCSFYHSSNTKAKSEVK